MKNINFIIENSHPSLPGHFPGKPIVPGVVILQQIIEKFYVVYPEKFVREIVSAKFKGHLAVDTISEVIFKESDGNKFLFQITQDKRVITHGVLDADNSP